MGQYDEQLKKQAQKRKSGNADYGLYLKKNKDGGYSDSGRGKRKTSEDKAAYQSGEKKASKSKLTSNVDDVLANARFVIDDPTVSFGSLEFDKNAFNRAAEKQKKWWENTGSTHKTYGYDMSDPEDVLRAQEGRYSKAYEASYGKDELSQWLMANGQASGSYFEQYYNEAAYDIMKEQQKAANLNNLRNEAIYEAWTAADNYENISGDDIAAAIQRLKLNNPDYADIEIVNPKIDVDEPDYSDYASPTLAEQTAAEKDAAKREDAIYLDDLIDEIEKLKGRQRELEAKQIAELEAQKQAEIEAAKTATQGAIDNAIRDSGFSAEIDNLVGLAKDSFSDSEYQANKDRKRAASTEAVNALMELGYSALEIRQIIGGDGRLSYIESEQGEKEESDRVQRMTDADTVLNDILSQGSPESQAAIERARKVGSGNNVMGTALREGFSPISMLSLTDEEIAYKDTYMDAVRTELAAQGFGDLEIDNAFRRADLEQYLDKDVARENYIRYVMGELGYDAEYTEAFIEKELSTDEGKAHYDKEMLASEFVENSTIDQIGNSISMIPVRAALDIVSSGVAAVDMIAANITGRKEMWQFTQDIEAEAAWAAAFSHDRNHEGLSVAADLGTEIVRMWATAQMGTKLAAGATKISPKTKGFNHLFNFIGKNGDKIPFVSNAMGSYYSEAMNQGATVKDATMYAIPAGLIEGMLESLEMGQVMQNSIGINFVGKKIAASGLPQSFKQLAVTKGLPFINFALDVLGEGIEEGVSALNASMLRTSTWDEYHELEMSDVWQNAKGGLILGGIMGGLSMPAHSQAYKYANAIYKDTGSLAKYLDSLQSAMHIENMDETRRNDLLDNVETTETTDADRENFINATVEIHNLTENIAAKKAAVEAAEQDAAVKVEAAEQKIADYKKRISVLRENNGKKKADKIKELSAQLNSAQKSAEQIRSESAKKVETAIADYKAIAAKANATIAKNQELIDKYHAAKYTADLEADIDSDIDSVGNAVEESEYMERVANINALLEAERAKLARLPQQQGKAALRRKEKIAHLEQRLASATDKYNASVAARTAEPTENTTAPTNTAENRIDTVKADVTEKRERIEFLKGEIMRKSLEYEAMPEPAEDSEDTEAVLRYEELGVELDNLEDELEALTAEVEAAETAEAEPTSTLAEAATESETVTPEPALKDLGANTVANSEIDGAALGIVNPELQESVSGAKRAWRKAKQAFISSFAEGERFSKLQSRVNKGSVTIEDSAQLLRNAGGTVDYIMEDALVDLNRKSMGRESYSAVMTPPEGISFSVVQDYLLNLHNIDRMSAEHKKAVLANEKGKARTSAQSEKIVKELEATYPQLVDWNTKRKQWWNTFGKEWFVNSGLISQEAWEGWQKAYPNYVPTFRTKYDDNTRSSTAYNTTVGIKGTPKHLAGSTSEVVDVRDGFARYINSVVRASAKNDVILNLYNFAQQHPNAAAPYAQILDDKGKTPKDITPDGLVDSLDTDAFNQIVKGKYILTGKVGGESVKMSVSKEMYEAVADLFGRAYNPGVETLMNVGKAITTPVKMGITTYNPFFAIRNFIRDTQTAYINDDSVNPLTFGKSLMDSVVDMANNSEDFQRFKAYGGDRTGFYNSTTGFIESAGLNARESKLKKLVKGLGKGVSAAGEYTETLNRYATFKRYLDAHGRTDENYKKAVQAAADGTVNFSRSGAATKVADAWCLYLNASVQGIDKMLRQFTQKETAFKSLGKTAGIAIASILVKHLTGNDENEHYQNLSNYVKDNNFVIPNYFGEKDENGYHTSFIVIPKAQGYGAVIAAFERTATMFDEDKDFREAYDGYFDTLVGALPVNPSTPFSAYNQAIKNESWSGATIEPSRMESEPVTERYDSETSTIAINISKLLNFMGVEFSPMKVQYVIEQKTGILGDIALPATYVQNYNNYGEEGQQYNSQGAVKSIIDPFKAQFVKDPLYSNDIVGNFYEQLEEKELASKQAKSDRQSAGIDKKSNAEKEYSVWSDVSWWLTDSYKRERAVMASEPNSVGRDNKIREIRKERIDTIKAFMDNPDNFKLPKH